MEPSGKPNWRPQSKRGLKTKGDWSEHQRHQAMQASPCELTVHTKDGSSLTANGESFSSNVTYSLNKGRRWELRDQDFVSEDGSETFVAHAFDKQSETQSHKARHVWQYNVDNSVVGEDTQHSHVSKTHPNLKKDRRRNHAMNTEAHTTNPKKRNEYSAEAYAAAPSNGFVTITESPEFAKTEPVDAPYRSKKRSGDRGTARKHLVAAAI